MTSAGGATCPHRLSQWEPPKTHPSLPSSPGIAVALRQAMTPEFKAYQQQVVANCKALSTALMELGYDIVTGEDRFRWRDGADPCTWPGSEPGHEGSTCTDATGRALPSQFLRTSAKLF